MKPLKTIRSNPLSVFLIRPKNLFISFFMSSFLVCCLKFIDISHYTQHEQLISFRGLGCRYSACLSIVFHSNSTQQRIYLKIEMFFLIQEHYIGK